MTWCNPSSILDIGAGEGTYATLLQPSLPGCRFLAIEIFEPYIEKYNLAELYDEILIGDGRSMRLPAVDVVIMGDVLEHMTHTEATLMWNRARAAAKMIVVGSIPIIYCPQGPWYGNEHEVHVHTWDHDQALALPGVTDAWSGVEIGCYIAPGIREIA